jgi:hypothetical protein
MSHIDKLTRPYRLSFLRRSDSELISIWRTSTLELERRPDKLEVIHHPDNTRIETGTLNLHYPATYNYPSLTNFPATG